MSAIRDGIEGRGRRRAPKPGEVRRWGLPDLALAAVVIAVMGMRTPAGGLLWYAVERLRGHDRGLPTLTGYFESGAVAPPIEALALHPPDPTPTRDDQLPEPWRTGAATLLADRVPDVLAHELEAAGTQVTPEAAMAALDASYATTHDPAWTLEVAALGAETVDRAIARATAAGAAAPRTFDDHRRFLSPSEAREGDRFVGGAAALATVLDLAWPLDVPHRVTSGFGSRMHPTLHVEKFHEGVDLGVPEGTPVHAAQGGRLAVVGEGGASGKYVVVDHGFGVRSSYCHLSETPLAQGGEVLRGAEIAKSGNTGRSNGPHLHYGVKIAGRWVDPERFRRP